MTAIADAVSERERSEFAEALRVVASFVSKLSSAWDDHEKCPRRDRASSN
jgi:hypothetical protein